LVELKKQDLGIFAGASQHKRVVDTIDKILVYFNSQDAIRSTDLGYHTSAKYNGVGTVMREYDKHRLDVFEGLIPECRQMVERIQNGNDVAARASLNAIRRILTIDVQVQLPTLYEDIRLLSRVLVFPVEKRMRLQLMLNENGFRKVTRYLVSAERKLQKPEMETEDCLANCRKALDQLLQELSLKLGIRPVKRFSEDLTVLEKEFPTVVDEGVRRILLGVFSFLSVKGSHPYSVSVSEKDATFGLEQTYRSIEYVLEKYTEFMKSQIR